MVASALVTDRALIDRFLRLLFAGKPDDHRLLLWDLETKLSYWSTSIDDIVARAAHLGSEHDVYVGCCTTVHVRDQYQRVTADLASGMPGPWADADVKKDQFSDRQAAVDFLLDLPKPPSLIVGSGHGTQPWWLTPEYWAFADEDDRLLAAGWLAHHTAQLRSRAAAVGGGVDATQDLARILRIPGTYNFKDVKDGGVPLPVTLLYEHSRRYPIDRTTRLYVAPAVNGMVHSAVRGDLQIDQEPFDALLQSAVPLATWTQTREAMGKDNDQSPSGYDMSLANFAARAGWSEQAVVDLLVFYRRYHGHGEKYDGYFVKTAGEARTNGTTGGTTSGDDIPPGTRPQDLTDDQRTGLLTRLRDALQLPTLVRVVEYTQDPPVYILELNDGKEFRVGSLRDLRKQADLRDRLFHDTGYMPLKLGAAAWEREFMRPLMLVAEPRESGGETTRKGQTIEWLRARLSDLTPADQAPDDVARSGSMFRYHMKERGDGLAIPTTMFCRWVSKEFTKLSPGEFAERIHELGGTGVDANYYNTKGTRLQIRVQWLPDGWDDGTGYDDTPIDV